MSKQDPEESKREGVEVFAIAYDEEGNELRHLPDKGEGLVDLSRDLGIGPGTPMILWSKHG